MMFGVVFGWFWVGSWMICGWSFGDVNDLLQAVGCCLSDVGMLSRMSVVILG